MSFTQKLSPEALQFFSALAREPFSKQAVQFLNAYWSEVGNQAPFIFEVAYETVKYADMHFKGVSLIHLYDEGSDMDFNSGLYFYEKLGLKVLESDQGKQWRENPVYKPSMPEMLTAIVRKQELREKVDVDFDGRISFLEYLLYQYRDFCNPADFCERSMRQEGEHPEVTKARLALEDVSAAIRAYQAEKSRLEELAEGTGVKALGAKNQLAQLAASPLMEKLNTALIKAEAAVRKATRLFGAGGSEEGTSTGSSGSQSGAVYWMTADLDAKKALYGRRSASGDSVAGVRVPGKVTPAAPVAVAKPVAVAAERVEAVKPKTAPPPLPTVATKAAASWIKPQAPASPPKAPVAVAAVAAVAAVVATTEPAEEEAAPVEEEAAAPVEEQQYEEEAAAPVEEEAAAVEEEQYEEEAAAPAAEEEYVQEEAAPEQYEEEQAPMEEQQYEEEAAPVEEQEYEEAAPVEEQQYEDAPVEEQQYEEAAVEEQQYEEAPVEEQQEYAEEAAVEEQQYEEAPVEEQEVLESPNTAAAVLAAGSAEQQEEDDAWAEEGATTA